MQDKFFFTTIGVVINIMDDMIIICELTPCSYFTFQSVSGAGQTTPDTRLYFFLVLSVASLECQAVYHATTLVDTRLAFLFNTFRGVA